MGSQAVAAEMCKKTVNLFKSTLQRCLFYVMCILYIPY